MQASTVGNSAHQGGTRPRSQARGGLPSPVSAVWDPGALLFTPTSRGMGPAAEITGASDPQLTAERRSGCQQKPAVVQATVPGFPQPALRGSGTWRRNNTHPQGPTTQVWPGQTLPSAPASDSPPQPHCPLCSHRQGRGPWRHTQPAPTNAELTEVVGSASRERLSRGHVILRGRCLGNGGRRAHLKPRGQHTHQAGACRLRNQPGPRRPPLNMQLLGLGALLPISRRQQEPDCH